MVVNNSIEPFRKQGQSKPPQYHRVFYYLLDFDRSQFRMMSQLSDKNYTASVPHIVMIPLGSSICLKYRFYYIDVSRTEHYFYDGKGYVEIKITIKEEISRNEFFSQYALGTLEGTFVATRDVEHLRKYLTKDKQYGRII